MAKEKPKNFKDVKTRIRGTLLNLFNMTIREEEITESEYLRDLMKEDVKKRYDLKNGMQK